MENVLRVRRATRADVPAIEEQIARCRSAAAAAGFRTLTLVATLPGEPLYQALGFTVTERFQLRLPDQVGVPVARMSRNVS